NHAGHQTINVASSISRLCQSGTRRIARAAEAKARNRSMLVKTPTTADSAAGPRVGKSRTTVQWATIMPVMKTPTATDWRNSALRHYEHSRTFADAVSAEVTGAGEATRPA